MAAACEIAVIVIEFEGIAVATRALLVVIRIGAMSVRSRRDGSVAHGRSAPTRWLDGLAENQRAEAGHQAPTGVDWLMAVSA
jgi:hypothetical protein